MEAERGGDEEEEDEQDPSSLFVPGEGGDLLESKEWVLDPNKEGNLLFINPLSSVFHWEEYLSDMVSKWCRVQGWNKCKVEVVIGV